jgi:hypothetical protein
MIAEVDDGVCPSVDNVRGRISRRLRESLVERFDQFPHVHIVRDYPVLQLIGEIRYRQYVENQGKPYASMVLDQNCLIEPSDFSSVNIYTRGSEGITCAMRISEIGDRQHPNADFFEHVAREFGVAVDLALTCTRLVRAPCHSGRHAVDLIRFVRWQAVRA